MASTPALRYPGAYVATAGTKPAIIVAETGAAMSYAELDAFAKRLGRFYHSMGIKPGEHVACCIENRLECMALQWGAHYAGLYYTFISNRLTPGEASYIVADCDAKVLVVTEKTAPGLVEAIKALPNPPKLLTLDAATSDLLNLLDAINGHEATLIEGALEGSDMLYSSGTTGRPKGVKPALTGLPLGSTARIADLMQQGFGVSREAVYLSAMPYYHAASLKWFHGITALGGTAVLMQKFDAEGSLAAIERYQVTHSQMVPTMFHRLLSLSLAARQCHDLSSLKVLVHAGAPCAIETKQRMIDWLGPIVAEYYSCTEAIGMTYSDSAGWLSHPGTVGRPLMGKLHIVDDAGHEVPTGAEGTVYFSDGPKFSYHKDEEKTRQAHNAADWATVGDIGRVDADGYLYLTDRKNNMIISGGVNVYPQETENVLIAHPKVFDVAVIGTPHEDLGEEVRAVVQLEPGVSPSAALAQELIAYCRAHLSPIKSPRVVDFRDDLPREPTGKLLKRLLRDEYRAKFLTEKK